MAKRVMIFDDDVNLLEICSLILTGKNFEVIIKDTCADIIREVDLQKPDLIMMDNHIADTGGVKATQLLKSHFIFSRIPVIFFSANDNISELAREAGADFYLPKPFNIAELENLVNAAINTTK